METDKKGRISLLSSSLAFLAESLLIIFPAFSVSCSNAIEERQDETERTWSRFGSVGDTPKAKNLIRLSSTSAVRCLDIFFFNNDDKKRLDSYQRIERPELEGGVTCMSGTGPKILIIIANSSSDRYTWSEINSYETLKESRFELKNEDPAVPVMSGETTLEDGLDRSCAVTLSPLMAVVEIHSLCCDFSMRPYSGERLSNVKIYLTNISSRCGPVPDEESHTEQLMNAGGLSRADVSSLKIPGLIFKELDAPVGDHVIQDVGVLYCYPNSAEAETAGTPFTRLVIEGELSGEKYYYPLNINRETGGNGVVRNTRYVYDITITRRGSKDPDAAVNSLFGDFSLSVKPWKEKSERVIDY